MNSRRVVVTGLGLISPVGNSVAAGWQNLLAGRSGIANITRFDASKFKTRFACEVKGFNPEQYIEKREVRRLDIFAQFAMAATDQAIVDSRLDTTTLDLERVGVIFASGIGGLTTIEKEISDFARGDGTPRYNPFLIPKMIIDIVPGLISIKYGFRGINFATVSACASTNNALLDALQYIRLGKADVIVCGGSEAAITATGVGGFTAMKAMSERNDDFPTASRPFDRDRDGFVLGEGAASFIVEEYEHAVRRGATIYGEFIGGASTSDAYHMTAPHPEGVSVARVMELALQDAGITRDVVDYINVHGTSTPLGDVAEIKAIEKVFGEHTYRLNISSTKSMTGHLLGAAGAVEGVAVLLALKYNFIPPTINLFNPDEAIDPRINLTPNKPQYRDVNVVMSNGFGFGGHNASVIFKKL